MINEGEEGGVENEVSKEAPNCVHSQYKITHVTSSLSLPPK